METAAIGETSEAIILVNPVVGAGQKRSIQFAGVTPQGEWVRLYSDMFEDAGDIRKLNRWNRIRFTWQPSTEDSRPESRRIDQHSIKIIGELAHDQRHAFLSRLEVTSLKHHADQGRSLALLRPQNPHFMIERKTAEELTAERAALEQAAKRKDAKNAHPRMEKPCPYKFKYRYTSADGDREELYRGNEINATFAKLVGSLGEAATLAWIIKVFGKEYLEKGVTFAMGTNMVNPEAWQIKSMIGMNEVCLSAGGRYNLVC